MRQRPLCNLANALTLFRLPASPLMIWLILQLDQDANRVWASICILILGILVGFSDFFDGKIARKYKMVTDFGKIMDPIADSTFFMSTIFAFTASERFDLSIWPPVIVLYREILMHVIRRYAALKGTVLAARWGGKAKTFIQSVTMAIVAFAICVNDCGLFVLGETWLHHLIQGICILIAAVNIISLYDYLRDAPALIIEYHTGHSHEDAPDTEQSDQSANG